MFTQHTARMLIVATTAESRMTLQKHVLKTQYLMLDLASTGPTFSHQRTILKVQAIVEHQ